MKLTIIILGIMCSLITANRMEFRPNFPAYFPEYMARFYNCSQPYFHRNKNDFVTKAEETITKFQPTVVKKFTPYTESVKTMMDTPQMRYKLQQIIRTFISHDLENGRMPDLKTIMDTYKSDANAPNPANTLIQFQLKEPSVFNLLNAPSSYVIRNLKNVIKYVDRPGKKNNTTAAKVEEVTTKKPALQKISEEIPKLNEAQQVFQSIADMVKNTKEEEVTTQRPALQKITEEIPKLNEAQQVFQSIVDIVKNTKEEEVTSQKPALQKITEEIPKLNEAQQVFQSIADMVKNTETQDALENIAPMETEDMLENFIPQPDLLAVENAMNFENPDMDDSAIPPFLTTVDAAIMNSQNKADLFPENLRSEPQVVPIEDILTGTDADLVENVFPEPLVVSTDEILAENAFSNPPVDTTDDIVDDRDMINFENSLPETELLTYDNGEQIVEEAPLIDLRTQELFENEPTLVMSDNNDSVFVPIENLVAESELENQDNPEAAIFENEYPLFVPVQDSIDEMSTIVEEPEYNTTKNAILEPQLVDIANTAEPTNTVEATVETSTVLTTLTDINETPANTADMAYTISPLISLGNEEAFIDLGEALADSLNIKPTEYLFATDVMPANLN